MELGDENFAVALFQDFPIRRKFHDGRWFYSIVDIIAAITQSKQPSRYWADVKSRLSQEASELSAKIAACSSACARDCTMKSGSAAL